VNVTVRLFRFVIGGLGTVWKDAVTDALQVEGVMTMFLLSEAVPPSLPTAVIWIIAGVFAVTDGTGQS
jgi:hypothetical protein